MSLLLRIAIGVVLMFLVVEFFLWFVKGFGLIGFVAGGLLLFVILTFVVIYRKEVGYADSAK